MTALILFYSVEMLGVTEKHDGSPYLKVVKFYSSKGDALAAYAETSCTWSDIVEFTTKEALHNKIEEIERDLINGAYNDYM